MRKLISVFLTAALTASVFAGCGTAAGSGAASSQSEQVEAEADAAEDTAAADEQPAADAAAAGDQPVAVAAAEDDQSAADTAVADEQPAADAAEGATAAAEQADAGEGLGNVAETLPALGVGGGLQIVDMMVEAEDVSEQETDKLDRAMRAYTPPEDSLLQNEAPEFYYYTQMNKVEQTIYDAMYMCATDPTSTDNVVVARFNGIDPHSEEFGDSYFKAFWGLCYDHPELFWLYNGTEASIFLATPQEQKESGKYDVYFFFREPYEDFEEKMTAFNDAAEAFLSDIDTSAGDAETARAIHDKLIETVTYNTPVMYDSTEAGYRNLAHTAYGALVADSDGNKNYAVCDGYSQAFLYLLQQCGIEGALVTGLAGSDADKGGHAWSLVKLDGDWYEVDSTWNDGSTFDEQIEEIKGVNDLAYGYYKEAILDPEYRSKVQHRLYNLTTPEMEHYLPDLEFYTYYSKDNRVSFSMVGPSEHIRAGNNAGPFDFYGPVVSMAPQAEGTKYRITR